MFYSLVLVLCVASAHALTSTPTHSYPFNESLHADVHLYWNYNDTDITFELHAKTTGWLGLGISPSGGMKGADIAVGWLDSKGTHLLDTHATGTARPELDTEQNLVLHGIREVGGITMMTFSRTLKACDTKHDQPITSGTTKLIWAYESTDPSDIKTMSYHGTKTRGSKSVWLLKTAVSTPQIKDKKEIRFMVDKVAVPSSDTTYWCTTFLFPKLTEKHHVVRIRPIIQKGHENLVHHMVLYSCNKGNGSLSLSDVCDNLNSIKRSCQSVVAAWAIGGTDFEFPEHVGYPVGAEHGPEVLLLETHYDNPSKLDSYIDSSGLELIATNYTRKYDAGLIQAGEIVTKYQYVPPGNTNFINRAYCPSECLTQAIPKGQTIKVFGSLLHAHLLGRNLNARLIRNNVEIASLGNDPHYDFNFQETRLLPTEIEVRPSDRIVVDCHYDSSKRKNGTYGGESTREEMCGAFIYYYPSVSHITCQTMLSPAALTLFAGATDYSPFFNGTTFDMIIKAPPRLAGKTGVQALDTLDWTDQLIQKRFQTLKTSPDAPHFLFCNKNGKQVFDLSKLVKQAAFTEMKKTTGCVSNNNDINIATSTRSTLGLFALLLAFYIWI